MSEWIGWHFCREDRCLGYDDGREIKGGETLEATFPHNGCDGPVLCKAGMHASDRPIDALNYAAGPVVCRVVLAGDIKEEKDKAVARQRTVLVMADATNLLHEFACWCAENALRVAQIDDKRCWAAIDTKRRWLAGEATDEELAAARDAARAAARVAARVAAWDAAWVAARAAAWDAARVAARAAAWAAARDAAWDAARDAAWDAAWAAQNTELEKRLIELLNQP